jgi:hypothetical protein
MHDCEATVAYYNFFCRGCQYATSSSLRKYGIDAACRLGETYKTRAEILGFMVLFYRIVSTLKRKP